MAERTRVELPDDVPASFEVYVNGIRQERGKDFAIEGRWLVFERELAQEGRLGFWRWTGMWLGVVGSYRKHETVDVAYEVAGRRQVATGLRQEPYPEDGPG